MYKKIHIFKSCQLSIYDCRNTVFKNEPVLRALFVSYNKSKVVLIKKYLLFIAASLKIVTFQMMMWLRMSTRVPKAKVGRRSTLILHRTTSKKGHEGFDDLKESVKSGEEFCKEVSAVLQERADLDLAYSRLVKLLRWILKLYTKYYNIGRSA